mgnify:CR=1 FL=1
MKKNSKYTYVQASSTTDHGARTYDINGTRLPSVTTILAKTKDQQYINEWKQKVGYEEAERIKNYSSRRGTAMHKFIEKHIQGVGYDDLTPLGREARTMAHKIIEKGLAPVEEYFGSEITLYYPGLYAGATDLICMHDGMETIVDFKQANQPKRREWIDDYYIQIAAYAMAHDYVHKSCIRQGVIMVCTPDSYYQEFKFQDAELRKWKHKFLKRLDEYHEIMREPKINNKELLNEFEKNKA